MAEKLCTLRKYGGGKQMNAIFCSTVYRKPDVDMPYQCIWYSDYNKVVQSTEVYQRTTLTIDANEYFTITNTTTQTETSATLTFKKSCKDEAGNIYSAGNTLKLALPQYNLRQQKTFY